MCREFFALPMQEKELYCMKTSSGIGYGRRFAVKEGARVDWVDRLASGVLAPSIVSANRLMCSDPQHSSE